MTKQESKVQSELINQLNDRGWGVLRLHPSGLYLPDKKKVLTNGLPDLVAFKTGRLMFIEVKRKNKTYKPLQFVFMKILKKFGVDSVIYRDGDNVDDLV